MAKKVRNKVLNGIADTLELIVRDLTGTNRSLKGQRSYRSYRTQRPIVIVKVIKEDK